MMKTKQHYVWLFFMVVGFYASAQNPFTEMLNNPHTQSIIDIDVPGFLVIADDLVVQGSECVGIDCPSSPSFGFDTVRLMENNLRMHFNDTSAGAGFPDNDWRFTFNDSGNGGDNYFAVEDATAGRQIFRVDAQAPSNSLRVDSQGDVGIRTANPVVDLHIADGDSPTMRLEQNGSSGFTPQTWDVAGNETNFFVRDVTNGSALPFRIQPGNGTDNTFMIKSNGSIGVQAGTGFGTINENASIELGATNKGLQLNRMDNAGRTALGLALGATEVGVIVFDTVDGLMYTWDGTAWSTGGTGGTDDQNISGSGFAGNMLTIGIEGGTSEVIDLSSLDNSGTDDQALTLNVNSLDLEDGGSVDLSGYLDNTDDQNISGSGFAANMLTIGIEGGTSEDIDLSSLDNSGTDDQTLTLNVNSLDLEDGGSVDLSGYIDNTDDQNISGSGFAANMLTIGIESGTSQTIDLSSLDDSGTDDQQLTLAGNSLNLEDGGSVNLMGYLDNTDNQNISGSGFAGTTLTIGIEGGTSEVVDLSPLMNSGTDDQQLTLAGNSLNLEDGGSVNLSGYLDNTDNQNISGSGFAGTTLTIGIEGGTSEAVDLSPLMNSGTDDQQLTLTGNSLNLEDGGTVDLSGYLDNTDDQVITNFEFTSPILKIEIENGNLVQVDLTLLLADLEAENAAQQAQIDDLITRMEAREECECTGPLGVGDFNAPTDGARLLQNVPNPFDNSTSIGYFIPLIYSKANIVISSSLGQILQNIPITRFGEGSIRVEKDRMSAAIYYYTLYVDTKQIDTKRMIVE